MRTIFAASMICVALAGCASSSGVFQTGPETYRITTTAITSFGGVGAARASAIRSANRYCGERGKHAIVTDATSDSQFTQGSSDVTFRCAD